MPFPDVRSLRLTFRTPEAVELPCLPTVAFHSVFGSALRALSCEMPEQTPCAGCGQSGRCAYPLLFEPEGALGMGEGVTNRAPPPVVIAPEEPVLSSAPVLLAAGARIRIRMTLIGAAALGHERLALRAMALGCEGGLGRALGARKDYVPMELEDASPIPATTVEAPAACRLELVSPLRLKSEGKILSQPTAAALIGGLSRRADALTRAHGAPPVPAAPVLEGVQLVASELRVIDVRRWSARQRRSMLLPGVVGRLELQGALAPVWDWLKLGELVQLGKGTSLGFGRYRLVPGSPRSLLRAPS